MNYDLDFRYRRALQPDALATIATATQAVVDAMQDARNAGIDPARDPATILLARHVGRIERFEEQRKPAVERAHFFVELPRPLVAERCLVAQQVREGMRGRQGKRPVNHEETAPLRKAPGNALAQRDIV